MMEIYLNVDDEFKLDQRLDKTGIASSQLLQRFEVKLEDIFQSEWHESQFNLLGTNYLR